MAAVADHDGAARVDLGLVERVAQQIALVDAGAVELGPEHALEIRLQAEMIDDAGSVDRGLAGRHEHARRRRGHRGERVVDALIERILEQADLGKPLAVE
ncbi:hypothetical protein BROWWM01_45040 [Bradyrhizobium ottawaense]